MMNVKRYFVGGRIFKTGLSVLITAWICILLELPVIFAVITAIVTTEPTTADSIKKGIIRLPASTIGAAIALFLTYLLGETAITYALSAVLTIWICHRLKLDVGILVATLTAVAMIPETNDHFLIAFISRVGTTAIGIVVSTVVNLMILPPKYTPEIIKNINILSKMCANVLEKSISQLFNGEHDQHDSPEKDYHALTKHLEKTFKLIEFQREEFKYHKQTTKEIRQFHFAQKQLHLLQQFVFHLGNLQFISLKRDDLSDKEKEILLNTTKLMVKILNDPLHFIPEQYYQYIEELDQHFWEWKDEHSSCATEKYHHHFAPETVILYEILSLHDTLEELEHLFIKADKGHASGSKVYISK